MRVEPVYVPVQVRAAIKKKVEKQRRRTGEPPLGAADIQVAPHQPHRQHKAGQNSQSLPPPLSATAAEDQRSLEETLEEMMQGPQRGEKEPERAEPVDLLPIVDSVFGQVGGAAWRGVSSTKISPRSRLRTKESRCKS